MKKGTFTSSIGFQVFLYFVFGISFFIGGFCLLNGFWIWDLGAYYEDGFERFQTQVLQEGLEDMNLLDHPFDYSSRFPDEEDVFRELNHLGEWYNVGYVVADDSGNVEFSNADSRLQTSPYVYEISFSRTDYIMREKKDYQVKIYIDPDFPKHDSLKNINTYSTFIYNNRYVMIWMFAAAALSVAVCLIWFLCIAGHRRGQEGIFPGIFCKIPLEIVGTIWVTGALILAALIMELCDIRIVALIFLPAGVAIHALWELFFLREFVLRVKLGKWWRGSLTYIVVQFAFRTMRFLGRSVVQLLKELPTIFPVVLGLVILALGEFMGILAWMRDGDLLVCWFLEKIILTPVILYCVLAFRRLLKGSKALAEGQFTEQINTDFLILDFKEHGENLNQISNGISKAVEERLKSERLKTELITNVSHDLKTPLTSVINYADLLGATANSENPEKEEKIKEYSEVLLRQANRLKKLLDDLVEASKATTGNIEVNPVPCELGVLLTQAAGEYEERFAKRALVLKVSKPEEDVRILADGKHLWRIFDNLLNNICKYAQEGSRVYLNMEKKADRVEIVFRNISQYELNVSPVELEERFVRGDASRHMEGSGLGLSIAKSLAQLQKGTLQIITDGDLFKVILGFPLLQEK